MTPVLRHERSTAYSLALLFQGVSYMSYTGLGWGRVDTSFEQYLYISNKPMEGSTPLMRLSRSGWGGRQGRTTGGEGSPLDNPWPQLSPFPNFLWGSWAPIENQRSTPFLNLFLQIFKKRGWRWLQLG